MQREAMCVDGAVTRRLYIPIGGETRAWKLSSTGIAFFFKDKKPLFCEVFITFFDATHQKCP